MNELVVIIDYNESGNRALNMSNLQTKFESFGFDVVEIDGHNHNQILDSLINTDKFKPKAIIAKTTKGFGFPSMENNPAWHHLAPDQHQFDELIKEMR
jgi:transketolase